MTCHTSRKHSKSNIQRTL